MTLTYLTTDGLSERIHYDARTIRDRLKDSVLIEGKHYFRPFGGRKILYIWETIERDMVGTPENVESSGIPMADGSFCVSEATKAISVSESAENLPVSIPMAQGGFCNG